MKCLNLLAFLLGLALAFVPFSYAIECCNRDQISSNSVVDGYYASLDGSSFQKLLSIEILEPSYCTATPPHVFYSYNSTSYRYSEDTGACSSQTINKYYNRTYKYNIYTYGACTVPYSECSTEPVTCSDGVLTSGEDGIDCGGECSAECLFFCPAGESILYDSDDIAFCGVTALPDNVGNCPGNTVDAGGGLCVGGSLQDVTLAATDPQLSVTFSLVPFETGAVSYSTVSTPETVVDNGDGTETVTITNTTTNNTNNTSTSTTVSVNRPSGSASGTGFSSSGGSGVGVASGYSGTSDITGETAIEENSENYDFSGTSPTQNDYDSELDMSDQPDIDFETLTNDFIDNNALSSSLGAMTVGTSATVCEISVDLPANYGGTLSISLCRWEEKLQVIGVLFLSIVIGSSILIVVRGF